MLSKRLYQLTSYYDSGDWDETGSDFPTLLLIAPNNSVEYRARMQLIRSDLDDELTILITTTKSLLNAKDSEIWTPYLTEQMLVSLD